MIDAEYTFGRPAVYLTDIERARLLILKSTIYDPNKPGDHTIYRYSESILEENS